MKIKFRVPSRQPEQHEPQPEKVPDYPTWERPTFHGCICPPPIEINGELFYAHDPACLVPGHGLALRPLPPRSVAFQDSRSYAIASRPRRGQL